jgi:pimeloyl-ACP methyl ester carboxylesterase
LFPLFLCWHIFLKRTKKDKMRALSYIAFLLFLFSCNTYKLANNYSSLVLKKNGLASRSIDLDKFTVHYWDSGSDKPVLILLHGFGTSGKFQWYKQSARLGDHFRLIIPDLLYFGSKAKISSYTLEYQVAAIESLLEKLQIRSCYLCGSSYGGLVAAELALKHPEQIKKLILMDTPLKYLKDEDIRNVCNENNISDPRELLVPSNPAMFKKLLGITYLKEPKMPGFMRRSFYENSYLKEENSLIKIYDELQKEKTGIALKNYAFQMPVLLIWGEKDELVPLHVAKDLNAHIGKNAKLEIIPDAAHLPNLENKKIVNNVIVDFLLM